MALRNCLHLVGFELETLKGSKPQGSSQLPAGQPRRVRANAFQVRINGSTSSVGQVFTPEMVQQMILSAFSALRLQGNEVISKFWLVDSGASNHMTRDLFQFSSLYDDVSKHIIHTANSHTLPALGIGSVGNLSNVLYVPNLKANLVSVGQLVDQNCVVKFSPNDCIV